MKDHVRETSELISVYEMEGPISEVSAMLLRRIPDDAIDPQLEVEVSGYGDPYFEFRIVWWRPKTEKELEKETRERKKQREQKKKQREEAEARERAEYEKLKQKYG